MIVPRRPCRLRRPQMPAATAIDGGLRNNIVMNFLKLSHLALLTSWAFTRPMERGACRIASRGRR